MIYPPGRASTVAAAASTKKPVAEKDPASLDASVLRVVGINIAHVGVDVSSFQTSGPFDRPDHRLNSFYRRPAGVANQGSPRKEAQRQ